MLAGGSDAERGLAQLRLRQRTVTKAHTRTVVTRPANRIGANSDAEVAQDRHGAVAGTARRSGRLQRLRLTHGHLHPAPMKDITELQVGERRPDGRSGWPEQDSSSARIVGCCRSCWRARRGTLLELGLSDDSDPRVLSLDLRRRRAPLVPSPSSCTPPDSRRPRSPEGGTFVTDRLVGDSFELTTISEKCSALRGVDVANLGCGSRAAGAA